MAERSTIGEIQLHKDPSSMAERPTIGEIELLEDPSSMAERPTIGEIELLKASSSMAERPATREMKLLEAPSSMAKRPTTGEIELLEAPSSMADHRAKRPKICRCDDDYMRGNIVEVETFNFMTLNSLKCQPGPCLNHVIGSTKSDNSVLICAIALGLGGEPKLVGRAKSVGAYVKCGKESGYVKISFRGDTNEEKHVIMRKIYTDNKSVWFYDDKVVQKKEILAMVQRFNIQVNNLTLPGTYLHQEKRIKYSDFVNNLVSFSVTDLQRSILSMVDGLKPRERKILFCSFKSNLVKEVNVNLFSGYVYGYSSYHHGEVSIARTIIRMAQDFVGSNNINLLQPNGHFGSRLRGGSDHAKAWHIFTQLSPITRYLFPKDVEILLDYLNDEDGQSIEPTWYMPIIPTVLVNGSEGTGIGRRSYVPKYNPKDIVANVRRLLNHEPLKPMDPWYRGFKGSITKTATKEAGVSYYTIAGTIKEVNETTLKITELPVGRWTQDYKQYLESIMTGNEKNKDPFISHYRDHSDGTSVQSEVTLSTESMRMAKEEGLLKKFNLTRTISTSKMNLFDSEGVMKKYDTPEQILVEFFHLRMDYYEMRKEVQLLMLEKELLKLNNKVNKEQEIRADRLKGELHELRSTPVEALWEKDLDALEKQLDEQGTLMQKKSRFC